MKTSSVLVNPKNLNGEKWPQFLVAGAVSFAAFTTGFHTGWPTPSLPKLFSEEYPFEVTSEEASYIIIIGHVGNLIGGLLCTAVLDIIGRKKSILLMALPLIISFFLIFMSYQLKALLYVARFIGGVPEAGCFTILPVYLAEIAEPSVRGSLGIFISFSIIFGMFCVNMIGSYLTIKYTSVIALVLPFVFLLLFCKMPESPYYLLMKKRTQEAEQALKFLRRKTSVGEELTLLTKDVNRQMSESGKYRDIFCIESNRKAFLLMLGARLCQQFSGVSAFNLYTQVLLGAATQSLPPHIGTSIMLLAQGTMAVLLTLYVDKYGRKPLLIITSCGCFLSLVSQAIFFLFKEQGFDVSLVDWFPLVMMIGFIIMFSAGLGPVVNVMQSEMFSASIKSKAVSIANVVFALSMLSTTKFFQATSDQFGLSVPYFTFAFCTFLAIFFIHFFLPETKGKTLEEIQQELKGNRI